ncbi:MAG: S8 family serine peptidase [Blastocatellia bacterium]|nr:S8 family serine peptidase [Blastocatellia bacterium]
MRSSPVLVALFLLLSTAVVAQKGSLYAPGELLVKFRPETSAASQASSHKAAGAEVVKTFSHLGWHVVKLEGRRSVESALRSYSSASYIEAAQPNYYYQLLNTPNDPDFPLPGMYGLTKISAPAAWNLTTGSSDVVVAVIDSGIRLTHEDLAANIWTNPGEIPNNGIDDDGNGFIDDYNGWDFRHNVFDPTDQHGHGTHVSGTIGAVGNNGIGVVGVNWNVRLMPIKIYNAGGSDTTSSMLIAAYEYVRMMKLRGVNIRVTNNSYGGCAEACSYDQATRDAIDALGEADILNVFAAGNAGVNIDVQPFYPASYNLPDILSVGASNSNDDRVFNFGPVGVDLAAPGVGIRSTTNANNSSYGNSSGTSMAAPHVAGAAALIAAYHPTLSARSLKATIMNNVDVLPQWQGFVKTGGRLNVANALLSPTVCNLELSQNQVLMPTKGGYLTIEVAAAPNCDYSVKRSAKWMFVETGDVNSGTATLRIRVGFNSTVARSGTITIGDKTLTIRQSREEFF